MAAHLKRIERLNHSGKYAEATRKLTDFIGQHPDNAHAHYLMGEALYKSANHKEAARAFEKAVGLRPDSAQYRYHLAIASRRLGRYKKVKPLLQEAIRLDPDHSLSYIALAEYYAYLGSSGDSEYYYRKALEADVTDPAPYVITGYLEIARCEHLLEYGPPGEVVSSIRLTIRILEKAISVDPRNADAHYGVGLCHQWLKDCPAAIAHFKKVMELDPKDWYALSQLGEAYLEARDFSKAKEALETALRRGDKDFYAAMKLAEVYVCLGEATKAIRILRKFENSPLLEEKRHKCLALAFNLLGDREAAMRELEALKKLDKKMARVAMNYITGKCKRL